MSIHVAAILSSTFHFPEIMLNIITSDVPVPYGRFQRLD
jgi:hypothetical protein